MLRRFSHLAFVLALLLGYCFPAALAEESGKERKIRVLVTVGGHNFEEQPFYAIFEAMPDVKWTKLEMPQGANQLKPGLKRDFDVLVMYDMFRGTTPEQQKAFLELLNQGIGVVSLHHNLCSRLEWPEFRRIIGGWYFYEPGKIDGVSYKASSYYLDQVMNVSVVDREHPVTKGIEDFRIEDESYQDCWIDPMAKVLLKTDYPKSNPSLAWTKTYGKSPIVYIELGHSRKTYDNPNYRRFVHQAIRWVADR
jgi:uncharacterized protein